MIRILQFIGTAFFIFVFQGTVFSSSFFPPDSIPKDTIKRIQFDTIRVEKVVPVYDTVRVYDTIFRYDTVLTPKPLQNAIELSFMFGQPSFYIISKNTETDEVVDKIKSSKTNKISQGVNIAYNRKQGKWTGQIGLSLLCLNQFADYNFTETKINPRIQVDSTDNSYWQVNVVDTFYEVTGTDSILHVVADSTWVPVFVSDTVTTYDTLTNTIY